MKTLIVGGSTLGRGDNALGAILMEKFLTLLAQDDSAPHTVFFYNMGVLLTVDGSAVLPYLHTLHKRGSRLLACGTCLDYFKVRLADGIEPSTMKVLIKLLKQPDVVML